MSKFFSEYAKSLKEIYAKIDTDVQSAETEELKINMRNFKKDLYTLINIAYNNSAIEGRASQVIDEDDSSESDSSTNE